MVKNPKPFEVTFDLRSEYFVEKAGTKFLFKIGALIQDARLELGMTQEELAEKVGLSLKKLKMGFKQIYGDTVYGFLFDYKMEYARQLLDSGSYNVNEVGLKMG